MDPYNKDENKIQDKFNIMIIGDADVGKTSILKSYLSSNISTEETPLYKVSPNTSTLGIDTFTKIVKLEKKKYKINFWDTAGQEKYTKMNSNFFNIAHGFIIVFAVNSKKSFNNLSYWLNTINETNCKKDIQYLIINNKCDLTEDREVDIEEIEEKRLRLGIEIMETSALKKINIDEAINKMIEKIIKSVYSNDETTHDDIDISIETKNNSKSQSISKICKS